MALTWDDVSVAVEDAPAAPDDAWGDPIVKKATPETRDRAQRQLSGGGDAPIDWKQRVTKDQDYYLWHDSSDAAMPAEVRGPLQQARTQITPEMRQQREMQQAIESTRAAYEADPERVQINRDRKKLESRIPFAGSIVSAVDTLKVVDSARRFQSGEYTPEDVSRVAQFLVESESASEEEKAKPWFQKVQGALADMIPYAIEFGLTSGAYTAARGTATAIGKKVLGEAAETMAGRIATGLAKRGAGVAAQTAVNPSRIVKSTADQQLSSVLAGKDQSFLEAMPAGVVDAVAEIGSERAGGMIGRIAGRLIPGKLKTAIAEAWMAHTGKGVREFTEAIASKTGWNGIVGELGEERTGEVTRGVFGAMGVGDFDFGTTGKIATGVAGLTNYASPEEVARLRKKEFNEGLTPEEKAIVAAANQRAVGAQGVYDLSVEAGAMAVPGAVSSGAQLAERAAERLAQLKAVREKGFVSAEDAAKVGLTPEESKNRATRKQAVDKRIEVIEQETQQPIQEPSNEVQQQVQGEAVPPEAEVRKPEATATQEQVLGEAVPEPVRRPGRVVIDSRTKPAESAPAEGAPEAAPATLPAQEATEALRGVNMGIPSAERQGHRAVEDIARKHKLNPTDLWRSLYQDADPARVSELMKDVQKRGNRDVDARLEAKARKQAVEEAELFRQYPPGTKMKVGSYPETITMREDGRLDADGRMMGKDALWNSWRYGDKITVLSKPEAETAPPAPPVASAPPPQVPTQPPEAATEATGRRVWREMAASELDALINPNTSSGETFGGQERFWSDNPDLAIGQGTNKGFKVELDPSGLQLRENAKPGTQVPGVGKEFVTRHRAAEFRPGIRSIEFKPGAVGRDSDSRRVQNFLESEVKAGRWSKGPTESGGAIYAPVDAPTQPRNASEAESAPEVLPTPPTLPEAVGKPEATGKRKGLRDEGRPEVMLGPGETATTSSGRQTSPFPKTNTGSDRKAQNAIKRVDKWLWENAVEEARSRGDEFNQRMFESEDPARLPPATKDSMNEYLFGQQPEVLPPLTKKLTGRREQTTPVSDQKQTTYDDKNRYVSESRPSEAASGGDIVTPPKAEEAAPRQRREHVVTFEKLGLKKTATGKPRATPLIKEFASTVPEFRYDPTLVVDKNGNLVFRDGYKFTFKPEQFGLGENRVGVDSQGKYTYEKQVEPGDVVRVDLESMGLKPATESEVVAKALEAQGFANVKVKNLGGGTSAVRASWKGHEVEAGQLGKEQWKAAGSGTSQEAVDRANQTIERIRWSQPGDPDAGPSKGQAGPSAGTKQEPTEHPPLPASKPTYHVAEYGGKTVHVDYVRNKANEFKVAAQRVRDNLKAGEVGYVTAPDGKRYEITTSSKKAKLLTPAKKSKPKTKLQQAASEATEDAKSEADEFGRDVSNTLGIVPLAGHASEVGKSVRHFFQRFFTSRGELPPEAFDAKVRRDGRVAKEMNALRFAATDFRRSVREALGGKEITQADIEAMNAVLAGKAPPSTVPEAIRAPLQAMRDHIDSLSRQLIAEGVAQGDLIGIIDENMGVYTTRSYRVFDNPKWRKDVPDAVRNRAIAAVRALHPGKSDADIHGIVESLLIKGAAETPVALLKGSKLGAKDLSSFIARKDIPPWLRELWGEYKDAGVNYARSVFKMSHLLANQQFLNEVRDAGLGKWLRTKEDGPTINEYGELITPIAADGSSVMAPLNGLYTTPEIKKAFDRLDAPGAQDWWLRALLTANYAVKYGKTVGSVQSTVRNVTSNLGFAIANGHWRLGKVGSALRTTATSASPDAPLWASKMTDLIGLNDAGYREYYKRLAELGVVGENVQANELKEALRDASRMDMDEFLYNPEARQARWLVRGARKGISLLNRIYESGDAVWKVYAFENESARLKKAYPNWTEKRVQERAAKIVRDTYPTYSQIPAAVKGLRRVPFIAPFVSFPSEVVRTTFHTLKLGLEEMQQPETRAIGAQRLAGTAIAMGGLSLLGMAMRALLGIGDDEDEDLRWFVPPWQENSRFIFTAKPEGGVYQFVDMGYSDPHAYLSDAIIAFMRGEDWQASLTNSMKELLQPFASEEILVKAVREAINNDNEKDEIGERAKAFVWHLWTKALEPGTLTSLRRISEAMSGEDPSKNATTEALAMTTGQRLQQIDVEHSLGFRVRDFAKGLTDIQGIARKTATSRGTATGEMVAEDVIRMERLRLAAFSEMQRIIGAARRLGVPAENIKSLLKDELSDEVAEQLLTGDYSRYEMSPQTVKQMMQANPEEFAERFSAWHGEGKEEAVKAFATPKLKNLPVTPPADPKKAEALDAQWQEFKGELDLLGVSKAEALQLLLDAYEAGGMSDENYFAREAKLEELYGK